MKKIFTLSIISILALCANAQKLSWECDGKAVANGSSVVSTAVENEVIIPGKLEFHNLKPELLLLSDTEGQVVITAEYVSGPTISVCPPGVNCITLNGDNTKNTFNPLEVSANSKTDMTIHAALSSATEIATAVVKVSVMYVDQPETTISVTLKMTNDPSEAGVSAVMASHSINVANGTLNYAFANAAQRTINLYAMSGQMVKSISTAKASGAVELAGLRTGIYLYRVVENGKTLCGKLIVR